MHDRVDEWMVSHFTEFDGKQLVSVAKGDLDLGKLGDEEDEKVAREAEGQYEDVLKKIAENLKDQVSEVRISHRLTDSPSCLVLGENEMAIHLQKLMKQAGHEVPSSQPVLEVNPQHPLFNHLQAEKDAGRFSEWSHLLFEQAMLSQGGQLENPASFVKRLNGILVGLSTH